MQPNSSFLLYVGLLLSICSLTLYIRAILKKETFPSMGAMMLFMLNTGFAAIHTEKTSSYVESALLYTSAYSNLLVLLVTVGTRAWARLERIDWYLFGASLAVLGAQKILITPVDGIIFSCLIEGLGTAMVISKMVKNPGKENVMSWSLVLVYYGVNTVFQVLQRGLGPNIYFSAFVFFNCALIVVLGAYQYWKLKRSR